MQCSLDGANERDDRTGGAWYVLRFVVLLDTYSPTCGHAAREQGGGAAKAFALAWGNSPFFCGLLGGPKVSWGMFIVVDMANWTLQQS